jgi:rRNA maturation endonuclease Nob1
MSEWKIECEECDNESVIIAYEKPEFCPICGRRANAEDVDYEDYKLDPEYL